VVSDPYYSWSRRRLSLSLAVTYTTAPTHSPQSILELLLRRHKSSNPLKVRIVRASPLPWPQRPARFRGTALRNALEHAASGCVNLSCVGFHCGFDGHAEEGSVDDLPTWRSWCSAASCPGAGVMVMVVRLEMIDLDPDPVCSVGFVVGKRINAKQKEKKGRLASTNTIGEAPFPCSFIAALPNVPKYSIGS